MASLNSAQINDSTANSLGSNANTPRRKPRSAKRRKAPKILELWPPAQSDINNHDTYNSSNSSLNSINDRGSNIGSIKKNKISKQGRRLSESVTKVSSLSQQAAKVKAKQKGKHRARSNNNSSDDSNDFPKMSNSNPNLTTNTNSKLSSIDRNNNNNRNTNNHRNNMRSAKNSHNNNNNSKNDNSKNDSRSNSVTVGQMGRRKQQRHRSLGEGSITETFKTHLNSFEKYLLPAPSVKKQYKWFVYF